MGNCVYTAKTFGAERYELMNTRSKNHNVPLIGSMEQVCGRQHAAKDVRADENGVRMDIAGAYPERVTSLIRKLNVDKDGLTVSDEVTLDRAESVTFTLMLRHEPTIQNGHAVFGKLSMTFDPAMTVSLEEIPVTDARMAKNFPGSVWRLGITSGEEKTHRIKVEIRRA